MAINKVGLAVAALAPPVVVGARSWPSAVSHPVTAVALTAAYELALVAIGFASRVFGELQSRWVGRTAEAIDRRLLWRMSRFERNYREWIVSRHRFVDLKGLATRGDYAPRLDEVFVDVSLAARPAHEVTHEALAGAVHVPETLESRQTIWNFLSGPEGSALAVIGAPGTGKTTLLKHVALRLAVTGHSRRRLPVLLYLRDHATSIAESSALTLPQVITSSLRRLESVEPAGWFARQLQEGRCVVLLDGLDEVASEEVRRAVSRWVEDQIEQYQKNDFVITSRPHGYERAPLNRARTLNVRRFTGEQITRFVLGWYHAIERLSTGADDDAIAERAADEAADLLSRLRSRPALYELATNPLLLTMIAHVHRYRGALPGSRAGLYAEICEVLLWRRDQVKDPSSPDLDVPGKKKEIVLRELAHWMMVERRRDIDVGRSEELLEPVLSRVSLTLPATGIEPFLHAMTASGLLVERESGLFAFAHLTLQEHLAALHIQHHRLVGELINAVDDDWWRETTLLYAARVDPTPVVEACFASRTVRALALAFDCADVAPEFAPETAARLEDLRQQALLQGSTRRSMRRLMTGVTVTRLLNESVRLSDDTMLCARPVSVEAYRLFLADTGRDSGPPLLTGRQDAAAEGIPQQDVGPLVQWINDVLGGDTRYRIPTLAEAADPAFGLASRAPRQTVWCANTEGGGSSPTLEVPNGVDHPYAARPPDRSAYPDPQTRSTLTQGHLGLAHAFLRSLVFALDNSLAEDIGVPTLQVRSLKRRLDRMSSSSTDTLADSERIAIFEQVHNLARTVTSADVEQRARHQAPRLPLDRALAVDHALALARILLGGLTEAADDTLGRTVTATLSEGPERYRCAVYSHACLQAMAKHHRRTRTPAAARTYSDSSLRLLHSCVARGSQAGVTILPSDVITGLQETSRLMLERLRERGQEDTLLQWLTAQLTRSTATLSASIPDICRFANRVDAAPLEVALLTLAASAEQLLQDAELFQRYRATAAGLTVLRERADGRIAVSETVLLIRS